MPNRTAKRLILGKRLRFARVAAEKTQAEVADKLGINRRAIINLEQGERGLDVLEMMAFSRECNVSPASLLEGL